MYVDGELVWGEEPDGTTPQIKTPVRPDPTPVTTTTAPEKQETTTTTTSIAAVETTTAPVTTEAIVTTVPVTTEGNNSNDVKLLYGDATCDGEVGLSDALLILQYVANATKYPISELGLKQADVDGKPGITAMDALEIQKKDAKLISKFVVE